MAVYTEVSDEALRDFLALYDLGEVTSFKGIAEGVENSNFLLQLRGRASSSPSTKSGCKPADLPFFIGLMEHLAQRGVTCPHPVRTREGEALGELAGRPAAIVTFLDGLSARRPDARPLRRGRPRRWRTCICAGADFPLSAANALRLPVGRLCSKPPATGPTRSRRRLREESAEELAALQAALADAACQRGHPRRPLPRQRVLPRRKAVRPDRLLFRLQRRAGL